VFFPDVLSGDQFTEKSDGEHLKPNDAAGGRVDQQRPAASGPKTINSKAPRQPAYHKREGHGRTGQEGGETDAAQQMRRTLALLRYPPSRAILDHNKSGGGQVLREQKEVKAAAVLFGWTSGQKVRGVRRFATPRAKGKPLAWYPAAQG
jgi:hypothetical protein